MSESPANSNSNPPADNTNGATSGSPQPLSGEPEYPPQLHAGKVGLGPNYGVVPLQDKVVGLKEEIKGKITKHPELVQKGHDRRTGDLKRKEQQQADSKDPFSNADPKDEEKENGSDEAESEEGSSNKVENVGEPEKIEGEDV